MSGDGGMRALRGMEKTMWCNGIMSDWVEEKVGNKKGNEEEDEAGKMPRSAQLKGNGIWRSLARSWRLVREFLSD